MSKTPRSPKTFLELLLLVCIPLSLSCRALAEGEDNPTGVSGIYNGNVTDGGNWDPFTGNMMRPVDDIVIPGSIGAYPLKWTRYWNSRNGSNWTYSYKDYKLSSIPASGWGGGNYSFPDGRTFGGGCASGIEEIAGPDGIFFSDGGHVSFQGYPWTSCWTDSLGYHCEGSTYFLPSAVTDPYGVVTNINYVPIGTDDVGNVIYRLDTVVGTAGRYFKILCQGGFNTAGQNTISRVEAHDAQGNLTQWVNYAWSSDLSRLLQVDYSDGNSAYYTYYSTGADLMTADDVRYNGPMRQIQYEYTQDRTGPTHKISKEHNFVTGEMVTQRTVGSSGFDMTETRGDGASRSFTYAKLLKAIDGTCQLNNGDGGKLTSYTDFLGHPTVISYVQGDPDTTQNYGFIQSVTDPNGHITSYERQPGTAGTGMTNTWGITKITHPDGSYIQQTFSAAHGLDADSAPWYLASRTDENGHTTTYNRDANNRIIEKFYPDGGYEHFDYNPFGEVTTHIRKKDGSTNETEYFHYDQTGRKDYYTDPMGSAAGDPAHTTYYSYYSSGPWSDRLQTVTYPTNASGQQASETYEYEKDVAGNAIAGRGLVTKITHADGTYVLNTYDKYGDLLSTTDELGPPHTLLTRTTIMAVF